MSAVIFGQPAQAAVIPYVARRNRNQEAMANTAKEVAAVALVGVCVQTRAAAQSGAAVACPTVPAVARNMVVGACLNHARVSIQTVATNSIDSNVCYGSENSCISKTTVWIKDQF